MTPDNASQKLPDTMPPARRRAFQYALAQRLRDAMVQQQPTADIFVRAQREQQALAAAVLEPAVIDAATAVLFAAMMQGIANPAQRISEDSARRSVLSIMRNRAQDASLFSQLLAQQDFQAETLALARRDGALPAMPPLPTGKVEEVTARAVQPDHPAGAEPAVHVMATHLGHRLVHDALARMFSVSGPLLAPLMQTLRRHLPEVSDRDIQRLAAEWLQARETPARALTASLTEGGEIYQKSMAMSEQLQRERLRASAAAVATGETAKASAMPVDATSSAGAEDPDSIERRVEDIAYTINHSLVCSVVDVAGAPVGNWVEKTFNLRKASALSKPHPAHGNLASWFIGEVVGDYAAVPVTVAFQRYAPGFMHSLRMLMEPVLGPLFRLGAQHSAREWATKKGFAADSEQAKQREQQIYEHEVRHLPQALMWTVSSTALNLAAQYSIESNRLFGTKMEHPFTQWLWGKGAGKLASSALTAAAVVGFRGVTPATAERWDSWTSKTVFMPLTESIGHLFGVKKEDVERMHRRREAEERGDWAKRVEYAPESKRLIG